MLFHEFGKIVETGSYTDFALVVFSPYPKGAYAIPMARVKNANPRMTPTYPSSGNIHILLKESSRLKLDSYAMRSDRWH
jgi:hypothetical protein